MTSKADVLLAMWILEKSEVPQNRVSIRIALQEIAKLSPVERAGIENMIGR